VIVFSAFAAAAAATAAAAAVAVAVAVAVAAKARDAHRFSHGKLLLPAKVGFVAVASSPSV
jgi:hypothetical protein